MTDETENTGWKPVATHTMSVDEVRAAVTAAAAQMLQEWREERLAEGVPADTVELLARHAWDIQLSAIERDLPNMMLNMKETALRPSAVH